MLASDTNLILVLFSELREFVWSIASIDSAVTFYQYSERSTIKRIKREERKRACEVHPLALVSNTYKLGEKKEK